MHPAKPSESTAIAAMLRKYLFMFQIQRAPTSGALIASQAKVARRGSVLGDGGADTIAHRAAAATAGSAAARSADDDCAGAGAEVVQRIAETGEIRAL
jgi:hypothetical protein